MAKNKIILDSNIFIAFYYKEDSLHEEALSLLSSLDDYEIIIPYCVIQEVSTILTYKLGKKVADDFLNDIQNADTTLIINNDVQSEIEFFKTIKANLSFTDLALLHLSQKYDATLLTFDQQLLKLYKKS
ncbi:MAG: PIN domain-containing protein [Candidatus Peregrinibacteria bacterium]|nr:PIN domain-containing protein [Candidatus Peregrinibacteria bacterium]MDZ4244512.1 PIN domain-containing protein [Candidatus Gracilibacteria bacterium]